MVRPAAPSTKQFKASDGQPGNLNSGSFNLLELHHELSSIRNSDTPTQEKNADFSRLITRTTNAVATAWYHFDSSASSSNAEGLDSRQPAIFVQKKNDTKVDHREPMRLVAEKAFKLARLQVAQHEQEPELSIVAAPNFDSEQNARVLVQVLQLGGQAVETYALILQLVASLGPEYCDPEKGQYQPLNQFLLGPANAEHLDAALQAICNACCAGGAEIALAATKKNTGFSLRCISDQHVLPRDANRVNDITRAMLEAAKYDQPLIIEQGDANKSRAPLLYIALEGLQCTALAFVPITGTGTDLHSMLLLAGQSKQTLSELAANLDRNGVLLHSILKEKPQGLLGKWRALRSKLIGSSTKQRFASLLAAFLFAALMLVPIEYRIEAPVVIEPVQKRIVTAPFDGVIDEVYVEPGGKVNSTSNLLKLDDEELLLQKTQLLADVRRAEKQKDIELANGTAAQVQILQFEISELKAKIDLINYQLENLLVTAPLDGLVVMGDLKRREGAAVTTGEALFEIAPLQQVVVEAAVAVEDVNRVEIGMPVDIRITAMPEAMLASKVSAIHLRSTIRDNRHVYIVESTLANADLLLKPGMIGYAKIAAGKYSLAWVWFHRAGQKLVELLFW